MTLAIRVFPSPPASPPPLASQQILISVLQQRAPLTAALVMELAAHQPDCSGCAFYRAEAVPKVSVSPAASSRATRPSCTCLRALERGCKSCRSTVLKRLRRGAQEGSGPPYGLLQGSLAGLLRTPTKEDSGLPMR
jgi:hypothetical protein